MIIPIQSLREGDKFKSTNSEISGSGICFAHKIIDNKLIDLAIIWDNTFAQIDDYHFWWTRNCELISSNNDITDLQRNFNLKSQELTRQKC